MPSAFPQRADTRKSTMTDGTGETRTVDGQQRTFDRSLELGDAADGVSGERWGCIQTAVDELDEQHRGFDNLVAVLP